MEISTAQIYEKILAISAGDKAFQSSTIRIALGAAAGDDKAKYQLHGALNDLLEKKIIRVDSVKRARNRDFRVINETSLRKLLADCRPAGNGAMLSASLPGADRLTRIEESLLTVRADLEKVSRSVQELDGKMSKLLGVWS